MDASLMKRMNELEDGNAEITDWLLPLTRANKWWCFGLCFLYLRNIKGYRWNHKRVYRIYCEPELGPRINPGSRITRDKPDVLSAPTAVNQVWSMNVMSDVLADGCPLRTETNHRMARKASCDML
jgi:putative transposase